VLPNSVPATTRGSDDMAAAPTDAVPVSRIKDLRSTRGILDTLV